MKRMQVGALAFAATLVAPVAAQGQIAPTPTACSIAAAAIQITGPLAFVCVNGQPYQFTPTVSVGKISMIQSVVQNLGNGQSFTFSAMFNPDPFVNFTFGSVNPSGFPDLSFDVFFSTPVVGGPYNQAASSGGVTVTATGATGTTGTAAQSPVYPTFISGYYNLANLNVNTGTPPCSVSKPAGPPNSNTCDFNNVTNTVAPAVSGPGVLSARLTYVHSTTGAAVGAGSSTIGFTGAVELTSSTVPEPATVALVATGLATILGVGLRRKTNG